MIYIGIDTGVHTGIAVWDNRQRSFEMISALKIHQAMKEVIERADKCAKLGIKLIVRVEDPRQRTWYETNKMNREEERKRLQGVGSVKRDASVWEDFLTDLEAEYGKDRLEFQMVAPKNNKTKLSSDSFKAYTRWEQRTNEHGRDAAMLVFGF